MKCRNCGSAVEINLVHCPDCGYPQSSARPQAGGVRAQVFEVVVQQALVGAPWRQLCAGPMMVNRITEQEVEDEIKRRGGGGKSGAPVPRRPDKPQGNG